MNNAEELFRDAIVASGLNAPDAIHGDGKLHRFSSTGRRGDDAGWYVLHLDNIPAGSFGDWRSGMQARWCATADNDLTDAQRETIRARVKAAQRLRDQEVERRKTLACERANSMWMAGIPAAGHPYLLKKRVKALGLRVGSWMKLDRDSGEMIRLDNVLYVPMRDVLGKIWSLQGIDATGLKHFLPGGRVKGCYHAIGRPNGRLLIAEGYATGATVHEATGDAVAVAFNSGNLEPVARALRVKYPCLSLVVAADDDWKTTDATGAHFNPGMKAAKSAAAAVGGLVAVPDFTGLPREDHHTDFNDVAYLSGIVKIGGVA
ncbi:toprim domain-containing protein [Variovorax guangxiensis]|uniref:Putative DNA primase/helicase n=1 Tax=Variovorax guangxiensis TaxID=1775474 RepID=A0A840GB47_9BURK|nr:toprim domain-containing protein [Variovorax guangxiensis]MBB4226018.1 putative DNA primase/helicase [Variovorax guangxiensis]